MSLPDADTRVGMYRKMTEAKMFEERAGSLMMSGQLETFYLAQRGQEASSAALGACLRPTDSLVTTYRGLADQVSKGVQFEGILAELWGKETGICKGRGGAMHYMDWSARTFATGVVGGGIPVSLGLAFAEKYRGTDGVAACVFGDGATNQGTFHESMNFASVFKLPLIFLCQNNLYGEATPLALHMPVDQISERAASYGMPGITVDGNDPDASYEVISEAVDRARSGGGPTLIEAMTFRLMGHFVGDPMVYMPSGEAASRRAQDPVPIYRNKLVDEGLLSDADANDFEKGMSERLDRAVAAAKAAPYPSVETLTDYVYA
jgi:TPP-dependent pyruvate/acetoin dehydrogenase alpha subunit